MKRDLDADLHAIRPEHAEIHERLLNWRRYVVEAPGTGAVQPMFRMYRPYLVPRETGGGFPVDSLDAMVIERAVSNLPEKHAFAIRWAYVFPWRNEERTRRILAVTRPELHALIADARSILKNRQHKAPQSIDFR